MLMKLIPDFKGVDFFPHDLRLPFMRYKDFAIGAVGHRHADVAGALHDARAQLRRRLQGRLDDRAAGGERHGRCRGVCAISSGPWASATSRFKAFGGPSDVLIRMEEQPGGDAAQQAALKKVS